MSALQPSGSSQVPTTYLTTTLVPGGFSSGIILDQSAAGISDVVIGTVVSGEDQKGKKSRKRPLQGGNVNEDSAAVRRRKHKEVEVRRRHKIAVLFQQLSDALNCGPRDKASLLALALTELKRVRKDGPDASGSSQDESKGSQIPSSRKAKSSIEGFELVPDGSEEPCDAMTVLDLERGIATCNGAFVKNFAPSMMARRNSQEASIRRLLHPDDWQELSKLTAQGVSFILPVRVLKDGVYGNGSGNGNSSPVPSDAYTMVRLHATPMIFNNFSRYVLFWV